MDALTEALLKAGEELAKEYAWCFEGGDPGVPPTPKDPFVTVLTKHVAPLLQTEEWRAARIAALRAELATLES